MNKIKMFTDKKKKVFKIPSYSAENAFKILPQKYSPSQEVHYVDGVSSKVGQLSVSFDYIFSQYGLCK